MAASLFDEESDTMISISLCMIVRDEEDVIGRCLDSISDLVDEIIIVDTGSKDKTKEIIAAYTDRIFDFVWIDDFAAARNYAFSHATCMYSMWLDADDVFLEADRQKFLELKKNLSPYTDAVMMKYNTGFDKDDNVTYSYFRERIIKNNVGMHWVGAIHEVISTIGNIEYSDCAVSHKKLHPTDPDRNLRIFEKLIDNNVVLDPRQQFYYGRELYYHKRYGDAITVFEKFLDEADAWLENKIDACRHCNFCYTELGDNKKALQALFNSFSFDVPRAEICCDIGWHFYNNKQYKLAVHWYKCALTCERVDTQGGFVTLDSYGFTPCIQLCVCLSRLGEVEEAAIYNEKAASYKPDSQAVIHNRTFFSTLKENQKTTL